MPSKKVQSIQGTGRKPGQKSRVAQLNEKTLKTAARHGMRWDENDVETMVQMIENDETTFDMAIRLQRSYYSAQVARSHVRFVLFHFKAFQRGMAAVKAARKASK